MVVMKNLIYIIPFLLLPVFGLAQKDNIEEPLKKENTNFKNQLGKSFEILGAGISYKRRINEKVMLGLGLGAGYSIVLGKKRTEFKYEEYPNEFYSDDLGLETYRLGLILEYEINKWLNYEFKSETAGVTESPDFSGNMYINIKNGIFFRVKKARIGFDISIGKEIYNQNGNDSWVYYIKPLIFQFPIKRW